MASRCAGDISALELDVLRVSGISIPQAWGFSWSWKSPSADPIAALVDLWFSRSRGYPLSVTLRYPEIGLLLPSGLVEVLKRRSPQWLRLELSLSRADLFDLCSVSDPFPGLRSLALDVNEGWPGNVPRHTDLRTHSPGLVALRLGNLFDMVYPFRTAGIDVPAPPSPRTTSHRLRPVRFSVSQIPAVRF